MQAMKHYVWAQRQRQTFLRQRQEKAMDYTQAGVPMRPAYAMAAQQAAAELELGQDAPASCLPQGGEGWMTQGDSLRPSTATGWAFASSAGWGGADEHELSGRGGGGSLGSPLSSTRRSIPLPKPTYGKVYERMNAEDADSPYQVEMVWRQRQEELRAKKEVGAWAQCCRGSLSIKSASRKSTERTHRTPRLLQAEEVSKDMQELDEFEEHLRAIQRQQHAQKKNGKTDS
jgi:hypothetical protein